MNPRTKLTHISKKLGALLKDLPGVIPVHDSEATYCVNVYVRESDMEAEPTQMIVDVWKFWLYSSLRFSYATREIRETKKGEAALKTWTGFRRDPNWPQWKGQFLFRKVEPL